MVTTNNAQFAETLRRFRNHGISSDARQRQSSGQWHYEMVLLGFNYRLPDIACALGIEQLKKLDANLARRREIAARYTAAFRELPGVIPPATRPDADSGLASLSHSPRPGETRGGSRPDFSRAACGKYWRQRALHSGAPAPLLRGEIRYRGGEYPVAEDAYERLISLPMFHAMTDQDVSAES
jgi:perosamine synthetase